NYFGPTLVHAARITNWTHVTVVYRDQRPSVYLNGKFEHEGIKSEWNVHSGVGVSHKRGVGPFRGAIGDLTQFDRPLTEAEVAELAKTTPLPQLRPEIEDVRILRNDQGGYRAEVRADGAYTVSAADGKTNRFAAKLPSAIEVKGPWTLRFPSGS